MAVAPEFYLAIGRVLNLSQSDVGFPHHRSIVPRVLAVAKQNARTGKVDQFEMLIATERDGSDRWF
jgi:hypothetical protein